MQVLADALGLLVVILVMPASGVRHRLCKINILYRGHFFHLTDHFHHKVDPSGYCQASNHDANLANYLEGDVTSAKHQCPKGGIPVKGIVRLDL